MLAHSPVSCKINAYKISRGLAAVILINRPDYIGRFAMPRTRYILASRLKLNKYNSSERDTEESNLRECAGPETGFVGFLSASRRQRRSLFIARVYVAKVVTMRHTL